MKTVIIRFRSLIADIFCLINLMSMVDLPCKSNIFLRKTSSVLSVIKYDSVSLFRIKVNTDFITIKLDYDKTGSLTRSLIK